jgi:large repetitive protein
MKRFTLLAAFAALLVGVVATPGSAASFDDTTPCPAQGPLLVCPAGQVGQLYSLQLRALAGCDIYRWEITNGGLPAGLSISSSGLITGTPTSSGGTEPWITVHDLTAAEGGNGWCGGDNHSERQFAFTVAAGLSIQNQSVPGGTVGQPYSQTLTALAITNTSQPGSPASATWSIQSGTLPAGVTFSSAGVLSGTPTTEGSYTFVVRAVGGSDTSDTETETLVVRQPVVVNSPFQGALTQKSEVGIPFTATQTATGGNGTFTWALASGSSLPAGLALGSDGSISGTPALPGRFTFAMGVTDGEGRVVTVNGTLVVAAKLAITTLKLKPAKVRTAYRATITTLGGVAPATWSVRGKLPAGVTFGKKLHLLIGTPRKKGTYRLTVQAVDALGVTAQKTLTLVVK